MLLARTPPVSAEAPFGQLWPGGWPEPAIESRDGQIPATARLAFLTAIVSAGEASGARSGGVLAGLFAPLRLPERVLEALEGLVEATRELRAIRLEITRVRKQTEPLGDILAALEGLHEGLGGRLDAVREVVAELEGEESHLNRTVGELGVKVSALHDVLAPVDGRVATIERTISELAGEVGSIHETVGGLKEDIQRITGLRGERGIMERARDVITGKNDEQTDEGA